MYYCLSCTSILEGAAPEPALESCSCFCLLRCLFLLALFEYLSFSSWTQMSSLLFCERKSYANAVSFLRHFSLFPKKGFSFLFVIDFQQGTCWIFNL